MKEIRNDILPQERNIFIPNPINNKSESSSFSKPFLETDSLLICTPDILFNALGCRFNQGFNCACVLRVPARNRCRLADQSARILSPPTQPVRDYVPCFGNFIYGTRVLDVLSGSITLSPTTMSSLLGVSRTSVFTPRAEDPS